jgi:hypothetical protein
MIFRIRNKIPPIFQILHNPGSSAFNQDYWDYAGLEIIIPTITLQYKKSRICPVKNFSLNKQKHL